MITTPFNEIDPEVQEAVILAHLQGEELAYQEIMEVFKEANPRICFFIHQSKPQVCVAAADVPKTRAAMHNKIIELTTIKK